MSGSTSHHDHDHDHDHDHQHGHDHGHGHSHAPRVTADNERKLKLVFALTFGYAIVQAVGGWWSGSLALIADSGHMVSDAAALLLALVAYRVAAKAANARFTYGFHRVRILAALTNGVALLLLVLWIGWEAIMRLREPTEVLSGPMLVVAVIGLVVNIVGFVVLNGGHKDDSNLRGALLHVAGDLLGSVGAIIAALGILWTGWTWLDPALSILVALLIVKSAWTLVRDAGAVLLQAAPREFDTAGATAAVRALPEVAEVGHLHVWTLTDETRIATLHITPAPGSDPLRLPTLVGELLRSRHGLQHVTVQVDPPGTLDGHCA